jgi:hypothetical protein
MFVTIEKETIKEEITKASTIPHATVFTGSIGDYEDKIFVKIEGNIYSIDQDIKEVTDRMRYWADNAPVKNYRPVKSMKVLI